MKKLLLGLLLALAPILAWAQQVPTPAITALACAYNSATQTGTSGQFMYVQCDVNGRILLGSGGAGSFTTLNVGGTTQKVSGGTGSIAPFTIDGILSLTGTLAGYSTTAEHMLSNNWTEQNVLSIWSQHDSGYSAINFLSSGKGAEFGAVGYGNHPTGSNAFSRRVFIEAAGYGLGGAGTVTFTNGSANIGTPGNNFEVGQIVVFATTGSLPTNFSPNTAYWVIATGLTSTNIQVAGQPGAAAIVAGSAGSGTQSMTTGPAELVFVQTGNIAGTSGSSVRQLFDANGNLYLGGVDAKTNPAVVIPRSGGIGLVDQSTRMRFFGGNFLFESYTSASAGFAFANNSGSNTVFMFPTANGVWQYGGPNSATPVAQTFAVQSGVGTNIAGVNRTEIGSLATGNASSGDYIIQTGGAIAASGTTIATAATAITIKGVTGQVRLPLIASDSGLTDTTVCQDTTNHGLFAGSGALGICLGTSGRQFKTAFAPMLAGIDELMRIDFINYRYRNGYGDNGNRLQYGTTAQAVEAVLPDIARHDTKGQTINYDSGALLFIGLRAIQQLKVEIETLKAR